MTRPDLHLYFAYGSNLDPVGMSRRCPAAVVVGRAALLNWRLAFRGVADVEPHDGSRVEGLLWACTPECVESLDYYEGVAGGFYRREWLPVEDENGVELLALVYVMEPDALDQVSMPSVSYLRSIVRGYHEYDLPFDRLRQAVRETNDRCRSHGVTRWKHDGRKRLRPADPSVLGAAMEAESL